MFETLEDKMKVHDNQETAEERRKRWATIVVIGAALLIGGFLLAFQYLQAS